LISCPDRYQPAAEAEPFYGSIKAFGKEIKGLEQERRKAARELVVEETALLRDPIKSLRLMEIEIE